MPCGASSKGSFTRCGAGTSWPQHQSLPSRPTAAECISPAATLMMTLPARASIRLGRLSAATATGCPHCPRALPPQDQTQPVLSAASAWESEVATSTRITRSLLASFAPTATLRGDRTAPISPEEGGSRPRGAPEAPQAHSSPQLVMAKEWCNAAARATTRRPGASRTRQGRGRAASLPLPRRPPTPRPHEKSAPAASANSV
eukprot:scaffold204265_cov27-Tisochrysis_lutea.AAC.2